MLSFERSENEEQEGNTLKRCYGFIFPWERPFLKVFPKHQIFPIGWFFKKKRSQPNKTNRFFTKKWSLAILTKSEFSSILYSVLRLEQTCFCCKNVSRPINPGIFFCKNLRIGSSIHGSWMELLFINHFRQQSFGLVQEIHFVMWDKIQDVSQYLPNIVCRVRYRLALVTVGT